ncbi:MAG: hypothetical protein SFY81_16160 [Verrucomicrobiota bacterium]|nr:hypothetical protein [Verrucomicrobiota bacterium]
MDAKGALKVLIWSYLFFLIFEGALRKWILPGLSSVLLVVRDPIVLAIYVLAFASGLFPLTPPVILILALGMITAAMSVLGIATVPVILYGFRCNFLHLPLIFLFPKVLDLADVKRMGQVLLVVGIPMALLMALQFKAGRESWLNIGAGGVGGQLDSAMGKVRASGTFSFISGPIYFYSLIAAFLCLSQVSKVAPVWVIFPSAAALIVAAAASGSRSLLGGIAIVIVSFFTGMLLYPKAIVKGVKLMIIGMLAFAVASSLGIYKEASDTTKERIEMASSYEGGFEGLLERYLGTFLNPLKNLGTAPLFGYGLGTGTNAGAALLGAQGAFILGEDEWGRIIMEAGPLFGLAYIFLRVGLFLYFLFIGLVATRSGNLYPLVLFGAGGLNIMSGQFGQPTTLGFAVFTGGLVLAARNIPLNDQKPPTLPQSSVSHEPIPNLKKVGAFTVRPD